MAESPAIGAIADAADKTKSGSWSVVHDFLVGLASGSSSSSSSTWFTRQPNSVTAQGIGSGAAQFVNPSVSGLAVGGNLASATYTAFKADETGFYLFGKKLGNDPLKAQVDQIAKASGRLTQLVEYPGTGLVAETKALKAKLLAIATTVKELPDSLSGARKTHLTQGGKRGVASNTAELDAIKKAVEELAEKLGV
ncbi:hypothetical protein [Catenulispora rubra]|uniref:hypothetical protein n=1 Tax=Catenulispora rubra TaxID=280293 RepID=UPI00189231D6|nr:hypothetical protein [Catenulispora rubra]